MRLRIRSRSGAAVGMAVASVLLVAGCNASATAAMAPVTTTTVSSGPPPFTTLATLSGSVPKYASPSAPTSDGTVPGTWYGFTSVLPVIATQPGWLEVRLAQRPNQSTAWIRADGVSLSSDPYRMVLNLSTRHLQVFDSNQLVGDFPAGIGTTTNPTPTGSYFVAFRAPSQGPGYGPFELATSDHSDTIQYFDGGNDAITAIHGPIDSYGDAQIGTTGARISYGCIRLHDADLNKLAALPTGTLFTVIAS